MMLQWGFYTAALGATAYAFSPVYRGLTIQFKVYDSRVFEYCLISYGAHEVLMQSRYIQMSGMILGGWTEADRRMREYEAKARLQRRMRIDRATWERFEREYQEPPRPKPEK